MSDLREMLAAWRHEIHMYPETAFEEEKTAAFVAEKLREMGIEVTEHVGKTGVVGTLKVGDGKRIIGLRADMDALNLAEANEDLEYKSRREGKMHGCGHDGHVASLLGAAKILSDNRNFNGTVRFIFQPAEEPGYGARAMLADGLLERFPMDEIYGLHNSPVTPAGTLRTRAGGVASSEDNFTIKIHGLGGHASAPNNVNDPLIPAAQIILGIQSIVSRNADPIQPVVASCTELHTDGAHNAIPGNVVITGDARTFSKEMQTLVEDRMRAICENTCAAYGAGCEFIYTHEFAPTINDAGCVEHLVESAGKILGKDNVFGDADPFTGSEDFGAFLEKIPGAFAFYGTGVEGAPNYPLHNPRFDFNDDMLIKAAELFSQIACDRLQ